jgi:transitional endoplasmic reticulum ATPase
MSPAGGAGVAGARALTLRVAEALPKDVGRAIARIDPADIERLGCVIGDIVAIAGKRKTAARIMPAFPGERGKGVIQIDGIIRENAQAALDDSVQISKAEHRHATSLVLVPVVSGPALRGQDSRYIGTLLENAPLLVGDRVRVTLFGSRAIDFVVKDTSPKGLVFVDRATAVRIAGEAGAVGEARNQPGVSYEDVGGLGREIARIREMIELPMRHPEVFARLGIEPPKGVLLFGPPGCGKTLIARAVAAETSAHFVHINGPEIIHKFYGESEANLRKTFDEAQARAPSIVFIDEIDAIAPKREAVQGEVEKRVVAQLLTLMDGLESRGHVVVIGATNIPDSIDPALRRPGRFDREISVLVPDKTGRLEILHIHTRGMPLAADVDLEKLAEITHGFVGADLAGVCREAAMSCLRRALPQIDFKNPELPYEELLKLEVSMDHFLEALTETEPSAIREVFTERPDVKWEDVGGLTEVKQLIREMVAWPLTYADRFKSVKLNPPKGLLLTGPPGTGKTLVAKAAAAESGINFISLKGPALISKWVGESEKGVREVFKKARQSAPCMVFFDELDALVPRRGGGDSGGHVTERVVGQFLAELDGIEELRGVVILGATNRPDMIDPALLRAGRFDLIVELPAPDLEARLAILRVHTRGRRLSPEIDLASFAERAEGFVGADLEALCRRAAMLAIRESIEREPNPAFTPFSIELRHFEAAFAQARRAEPAAATDGGAENGA